MKSRLNFSVIGISVVPLWNGHKLVAKNGTVCLPVERCSRRFVSWDNEYLVATSETKQGIRNAIRRKIASWWTFKDVQSESSCLKEKRAMWVEKRFELHIPQCECDKTKGE